jgi:hypothetical protein
LREQRQSSSGCLLPHCMERDSERGDAPPRSRVLHEYSERTEVIEAKVATSALQHGPKILARIRRERPTVQPDGAWPPKGQARPSLSLDVGVPSGRWALIGAAPHEFATPGHDWALPSVVGTMRPGNRRTVRVPLYDETGARAGVTNVTLRLYFWQQLRIPLLFTAARCFAVDVHLTSEAGAVDVRSLESRWMSKLTVIDHAVAALNADAEQLAREREHPPRSAWETRAGGS